MRTNLSFRGYEEFGIQFPLYKYCFFPHVFIPLHEIITNTIKDDIILWKSIPELYKIL